MYKLVDSLSLSGGGQTLLWVSAWDNWLHLFFFNGVYSTRLITCVCLNMMILYFSSSCNWVYRRVLYAPAVIQCGQLEELLQTKSPALSSCSWGDYILIIFPKVQSLLQCCCCQLSCTSSSSTLASMILWTTSLLHILERLSCGRSSGSRGSNLLKTLYSLVKYRLRWVPHFTASASIRQHPLSHRVQISLWCRSVDYHCLSINTSNSLHICKPLRTMSL